LPGGAQIWHTIVMSCPLPRSVVWKRDFDQLKLSASDLEPHRLTEKLNQLAKKSGADLFGVAPVERIDKVVNQLIQIYEATDYFVVRNKGYGLNMSAERARPINPIVTECRLTPKKPTDYIPEARSVIVIGARLLNASVDNAGKPPAYKTGHYTQDIHKAPVQLLSEAALAISKILTANGFQALGVLDLENLGSELQSTHQPGLRASRFTALAAGLGELGWNGLLLTPEYGPRQRFFTIITDAPLVSDSVYKGPQICHQCHQCVQACPVSAISDMETNEIELEDQRFTWGSENYLKCEWASRYGLVGQAGPKHIGCTNNFSPPDEITREALLDAVKDSDRIAMASYCSIVEGCFTECSAGKTDHD
jgi:epoxyqueuosine reductase QueG